MNYWLQQSIDLANNGNYLDRLADVYPMEEDERRTIPLPVLDKIVYNIENVGSLGELFDACIRLDLFPIKDSYVAYLRKNRDAVGRNPETLRRIEDRIRSMGVERVLERITEPKETNRQIGPMFRNWLIKQDIGFPIYGKHQFYNSTNNALFDGSDKEMMEFARLKLGYEREKGLDFVARVNGKYIIGESKFLTDHGGHQNAQLNDAFYTLNADVEAVKVAILDGVCYIKGRNKMYRTITESYGESNIMSALMLEGFLKSI